MQEASLERLPTRYFRPKRVDENPNGGNHELRLDFSDFFCPGVLELEYIVLLFFIPCCGYELSVVFDVWFDVVFACKTFPVIIDLLARGKETAPVRVGVN
jgi:hypothetical protein